MQHTVGVERHVEDDPRLQLGRCRPPSMSEWICAGSFCARKTGNYQPMRGKSSFHASRKLQALPWLPCPRLRHP